VQEADSVEADWWTRLSGSRAARWQERLVARGRKGGPAPSGIIQLMAGVMGGRASGSGRVVVAGVVGERGGWRQHAGAVDEWRWVGERGGRVGRRRAWWVSAVGGGGMRAWWAVVA
jgi:hypothetical protein